MDIASKKYSERPKASALTIINFLLLCVVLVFMFVLSAKMGTSTSTTASTGNTTSTTTPTSSDTASMQQQIADLSTKISNLTLSVETNKSTSTKPFNYLSCNGTTISSGSTSTMSSQCYPY